MSHPAPSLVVHRHPERQSYDRAVLDRLLAESSVAHVAFVRDGMPVVLPFVCAVGDLHDGAGPQLLLHGSTGGGIFLDAGDEGLPVCVAVTALDGFVFARALNGTSANFRSAVVFGRATVVPSGLRQEALWAVADHLMPGRRAEVREMSDKELAQTQVLRVPLDQVSVKVRSGGPGESADDAEDHSVWAGVVPLALHAGDPITSPLTEPGVPPSPSVQRLVDRLA